LNNHIVNTMRIILYLLQKEFLQIFRNKTILPLIFVLPVVQLVVLVNAATMDMKNIRVTIVDNDISTQSQRLIQDLNASLFFNVGDLQATKKASLNLMKSNKTDVVIYIPNGFSKKIHQPNCAPLQIITDAIDIQRAQLAYGYISGIIQKLAMEWQTDPSLLLQQRTIKSHTSYWFNPELNYKYFMLPGILVILVTIIGLFLSAINLVREKEIGTAEQMNVTPVKKYQFIIGKLMPFMVIGLIELSIGLLIGQILYGIPFNGNPLVLFSFTSLYLLVILSLGLVLSSQSETQQQVVFMSYFFMLIFILMSGVFTAVENMPQWALYINTINPMYYFMTVIRSVVLKGAGFIDLWPEFKAISIYAIVSVFLAIVSYRKTAQ